MSKITAIRICQVFERLRQDTPDVTIDRLFKLTADELGIAEGDVEDALEVMETGKES